VVEAEGVHADASEDGDDVELDFYVVLDLVDGGLVRFELGCLATAEVSEKVVFVIGHGEVCLCLIVFYQSFPFLTF
jgi:hypothetical protein